MSPLVTVIKIRKHQPGWSNIQSPMSVVSPLVHCALGLARTAGTAWLFALAVVADGVVGVVVVKVKQNNLDFADCPCGVVQEKIATFAKREFTVEIGFTVDD